MSGLERPDKILPVKHGHAEDDSTLLQHALRKYIWMYALFHYERNRFGDSWLVGWFVDAMLRCIDARLENTLPLDCAR
jgi:hypothetical protein